MAKEVKEVVAPRTIIYDIDRGLSSLATDDQIEKVFGYKPRRFIKIQSFINLFQKLHTPGVIQVEDDLGPIEQEVFKGTKDIQIEVVDSISAYQHQVKKEVKGEADRISLPMWGEIGETLEELVYLLTRTDTHVIILGHVKAESDNDLGIIRFVPALSGRMQNEIGRYFDMVLYTNVETDKTTGHREYKWQVLADDRRSAKCRIEAISKWAEDDRGRVPQDFEQLFKRAAGHKALKILILGETGTGKTRSLRTLKGAGDYV